MQSLEKGIKVSGILSFPLKSNVTKEFVRTWNLIENNRQFSFKNNNSKTKIQMTFKKLCFPLPLGFRGGRGGVGGKKTVLRNVVALLDVLNEDWRLSRVLRARVTNWIIVRLWCKKNSCSQFWESCRVITLTIPLCSTLDAYAEHGQINSNISPSDICSWQHGGMSHESFCGNVWSKQAANSAIIFYAWRGEL